MRATPYSKLVVEIASVAGHEPAPSTIDFIKTFLESHVNKPDGIEVVTDPSVEPTGTGGLTLSDLAWLESTSRTHRASGATMSVYLTFLDNHSSKDSQEGSVLGTAYGATSIVIFEDTLRALASGADRPLTEKTVIAHEFGHLFGLVNISTPMTADHYDASSGNAGHCSNPKCLMNFAVHTANSWDLFGGQVPDFDLDCLNDLKAAGGK